MVLDADIPVTDVVQGRERDGVAVQGPALNTGFGASVTDTDVEVTEVAGAPVLQAEVSEPEIIGAEVSAADVVDARVAVTDVIAAEVSAAIVVDAEVADAEVVGAGVGGGGAWAACGRLFSNCGKFTRFEAAAEAPPW